MKSGGPSSSEGKTVSRWNATRHGISSPAPVIPGLESKDDWSEHHDGIMDSLDPSGALEKNLAARVALMLWRLHRVTRYETEAIALAQSRVEDDLQGRRQLSSSFAQGGTYEATHPEDVRFEAKHERASYNALRRYENSQRGAEKSLKGRDVGAILFGFYIEANRQSGADLDIQHLDLPGLGEDHDVYEPPAMKASEVEVCLDAIVRATGEDLDVSEVLDGAVEDAERRARSSEMKHEDTLKEVNDMKSERLLANEKVLEKVQKYESHLSRQLYHALHELENLQAHRKGGKGTPLARLDVQGMAER